MFTSRPAKVDDQVWRSREHKRLSSSCGVVWRPDSSGLPPPAPPLGAPCDPMAGWTERGQAPCSAAGQCVSCRPTTPASTHKKTNGTRAGNSEVLKRFRGQTAGYELSQDLLEKRVEMLERKYGGGDKARNAAVTIQRAYRRYKLLHKFAAITAQAKAEKRLSRRFQVDNGSGSPLDWSPSHHHYPMISSVPSLSCCAQPHYFQNAEALPSDATHHLPCDTCGVGFDPEQVIRSNFAALNRDLREASKQRPPRPIRSLSMRERRAGANVIGTNLLTSAACSSVDIENHPPLPRSLSAGVTSQAAASAKVLASESELADRDMPSYSQFDEYYMYYSATYPPICTHHCPCPEPSSQTQHFIVREGQEEIVVHANGNLARESAARRTLAMSPPCTVVGAQWTRGGGALSPGGTSNCSSSSSRSPSTASVTFSTSAEWGPQGNKKVPPEVPKRTTSILSRSRSNASSPANVAPGHSRGNSLLNGSVNLSVDSASLSSSDSSLSLSADRAEESPMWKKTVAGSPERPPMIGGDDRKEVETLVPLRATLEAQPPMFKVSETVKKRQYRVGLNLFNKKPEKGIVHLIRKGFLENSADGVARFLITRKGLSKQMIGEYLGTLQNAFNMAVLECFARELVLTGMDIDIALRKFQTYFRMPGEAQKIERLMEVFGQRYCECNPDLVARFHNADTVFVLAFAVIMLNTDLHTPNMKPDRRMKLEDFVKNLRGIDDGNDIDRDLLMGIYERVKHAEFKPGSDHVTQVMKVQSTIGGKKPNLALPHRRLVCYCRLYEIPDVYKKERPGVHQREVFLFNDLLVITKIFSKKKSSVTYSFRQSFTLCGMMVSTFETQYYQYGIKLSQRLDGKVLVMFNARNEHDRCKFAEDLRESICEMDEMENIRIEAELERQKSSRRRAVAENRDSGVADVEVALSPTSSGAPAHAVLPSSPPPVPVSVAAAAPQVAPPPHEGGCDRACERPEGLKRSALSNSLLDINDQFSGEKPQRRGSVGSLDSGMSISFQSNSASTVSRDSSPQNMTPGGPGAPGGSGGLSLHAGKPGPPSKSLMPQQSFLGGLFGKKDRKTSRTDEVNPFSRSTEV